MQDIVLKKILLFLFVGILIIDTLYKLKMPNSVKKILHNSIFKISLITYLIFKLNYTIEFSLVVSVIVLSILELVREIKYYEMMNNEKEYSNFLNTVDSNVSTGCKPTMPILTLPQDNNNIIAKIITNSVMLSSSGKCIMSVPYETVLVLGTYKNILPKKEDNFKIIPDSLMSIVKEEPGIIKEIHMIVRNGYKVTFQSFNDMKTLFSATNNSNSLFNNSDDIKKALNNITNIYVEAI